MRRLVKFSTPSEQGEAVAVVADGRGDFFDALATAVARSAGIVTGFTVHYADSPDTEYTVTHSDY